MRCPNTKSRASGAKKCPFCLRRLGTRGRFFWRTGRFEPPDVTYTSGNVAFWASRALKYLNYHRAGWSNHRFDGCAAKKSPFLPKRAEQAKRPQKSQKSVSSQCATQWRVVKCGCAAKAPDFRWVTPKGTQGAPRGLFLRWLGVLAPRNARCPRASPRHWGGALR